MPPVDATFDGVHIHESLDFTISLGSTADNNSFRFPGGGYIVTTATLFLTDGTNSLNFHNLEPIRYGERTSGSGLVTTVQIADLRRKWATRGHITGEFNKPKKDGTVNQQKNSQELAELLVLAMGATVYDVSALPVDHYPYVLWEMAKPGSELNSLCDDHGCVLSVDFNGNPEVFKLGVGAGWPAGDYTESEAGQEATFKPEAYRIRGARAVVQRTSELIPVGLDTDGSVKPIADLSYYSVITGMYSGSDDNAKVANGVKNGFYEMRLQTGATALQKKQQECATKSVWRWFRVPDAELMLLPALDHICETITEGGEITWRRPYVDCAATWFTRLKSAGDFESTVGEVHKGYDIDCAKGIVKLNEIPFNAARTGLATVELTWAYHQREDDGTLSDACYYFYLEGVGWEEQLICIDWLVLRGTRDALGVVTWLNQADLDTIAAKIIDQVEEATDYITSGVRTYTGIVVAWPDGVIRQVTWHVGSDGCTTTISRNTQKLRLGDSRISKLVADMKTGWESSLGALALLWVGLRERTRPDQGTTGAADSFSDTKEWIPFSRPGYNTSNETAPDNAVVQLLVSDSENEVKFTKARWPGFASVGVIPNAIDSRHHGPVVVENTAIVRYNLEEGETLKRGDRLGLTRWSWYAKKSELGPLKVVSIRSSSLAEVMITQGRGDNQVVTDCLSAVHEPFEVICFGDEYHLTELEPGVILVGSGGSLFVHCCDMSKVEVTKIIFGTQYTVTDEGAGVVRINEA